MFLFHITYYTLSDARAQVSIQADSLQDAIAILQADDQKYLFAQLTTYSQETPHDNPYPRPS